MSAAFFIGLWGLGLWAALPLNRRAREEAADRRAALAVEWSEVRDFNARRGLPDADLLRELRAAGVSALAIAPSTLEELVLQRRVYPQAPSPGAHPRDAIRLQVNDPELAQQMWKQWSWRRVSGLVWSETGGLTEITRTQGSFAPLDDVEVGYDPRLLQHVRNAGLAPIFRVYDDPWLTGNAFQRWLASLPSDFMFAGVLFSSEELPGQAEGRSFWRSWLKSRGVVHVHPEFHPTLAARQIARLSPANTHRVHSIPASEMKDFPPAKQEARWRRALQERSCRVLLVRMGPNDSWDSFLSQLTAVSELIQRSGFQTSFPQPRPQWGFPSRFQQALSPWLALAVVCLTPAFALAWAMKTGPKGWAVFLGVILVSLAGALVAAAIADNSYTRLAITPFRGVKAGFLISWGLSLLVLYDWTELRGFLSRVLTRKDLCIGVLAVGALGYLLLRSGNASAGWKPPWEQAARDSLEALLVARPRFKEWALGYPLLWAGCYLRSLPAQRRVALDGRLFICLGMIGPISMINTFCHLHSPLWVELLRSFNGVVIGILGGALLAWIVSRWWSTV